MPVYPIGYYDNYIDNHFDRFVFANPSRNRDFPRCGQGYSYRAGWLGYQRASLYGNLQCLQP